MQAKRGGHSRDFFGPSEGCGLIVFELEEKVSSLSHNLLHALKLTVQRIGGDRGSRQIAPGHPAELPAVLPLGLTDEIVMIEVR